MKRRFFSFALALVFVVAGLCLPACSKKEVWTPPRNVVQNLPDKIHVTYNESEYSHGLIFVKDGNEYYINGINKWHADRREVYMRRNLTHEVCKSDDGNGWGFISAHWDYYSDGWVLAADETDYTPLNGTWHANDDNDSTYVETEVITRTGYGDVNTPILDYVTITQLENETVTLRSAQQVECEVWDYVYENGDTYSHYRYWYAADTGVYIKSKETFDKAVDIATDGYNGDYTATYYKVGDSMDAALQVVSASMGEERTKYAFGDEYN